MNGLQPFVGALLADSNGALVGAVSSNGKEYLTPSVFNSAPASTQPAAIFNSAVTFTGGTIDNVSIGATTRNAGRFSTLSVTAVDSTGTPGNVTNNSAAGRAAFAAAASTVVVTNALVLAADTVMVTLLGAADATLTGIVGVTVAAGSFTVTGNAAATATKGFMFTVIKA
jgi:hypothetical protein